MAFLQRYLPRFYRSEQRATAALVIRGRFGGLERKTSEVIAIEAGLPRKPIEFFVGAGKWVMAELRQHVRQEMVDPDGVVIVDPSASPRRGPSPAASIASGAAAWARSRIANSASS